MNVTSDMIEVMAEVLSDTHNIVIDELLPSEFSSKEELLKKVITILTEDFNQYEF